VYIVYFTAQPMKKHCKKPTVSDEVTQSSLWRWCNKHRNM